MRKTIAALALLAATQANAADFTLVYRASQMVVHMTGTINFGDEAKAAIAFASDAKAVELDSPGGSVAAAVHIGDMIAQRGMATIVDDSTMCAAACAFIWLAGAHRFLSPTARLGFHGAYNLIGSTATLTSSGNALVGAYMARMQLKDETIEYLTTAQPNQMTWIDTERAANLGISSYGDTSGQIDGFLQHEQNVRDAAAAANAPKSTPVMAYAIKPPSGRAKPFNIKPPASVIPDSAMQISPSTMHKFRIINGLADSEGRY